METIDLIDSAMRSWHEAKLAIETAGGISNEALHIILGLSLWLAVTSLTGRRLGAFSPIVLVVAVAVWNEVVDLAVERWPDRNLQYQEGTKDLILTILPPLLIIFAFRVSRALIKAFSSE